MYDFRGECGVTATCTPTTDNKVRSSSTLFSLTQQNTLNVNQQFHLNSAQNNIVMPTWQKLYNISIIFFSVLLHIFNNVINNY